MSVAPDLRFVTVEEYLATEEASPVRREFLGGAVVAMSGGTNRHGLIVTNLAGLLWSRLRGHRCRAFSTDTKVRVQLATHVRFYYPDGMVVCDLNRESEHFQDRPVLVVEVLSPTTRRTDLLEKLEAYLAIPSLAVYLMAEQDAPVVVAVRREGREVYEGLEATIPLPELGFELPLAELYERVDFSPDDA